MSVINSMKQVHEEIRAAWTASGGANLAKIAEERALTKEEREQFEAFELEIAPLEERYELLRNQRVLEERAIKWGEEIIGGGDRPAGGQEWRNLATGEQAALRGGESISQHPAFARAAGQGGGEHAEANYGNLGAMIRALAVGGTGSAIIPTLWAGNLIDLARTESAVAKSGATIVPMDAGTIKIARQTGDPSANFRAEGSAITPSDPTFDTVDLTAKTASAIVVASMEWWQDAENADSIVVGALAKAIAAKLDLVALYGGITTGRGSINLVTPPNPRGILAALNALKPANVLGTGAANGTPPTVASGLWNEIIDAVFTVKDGNEDPNAILWSSKLARIYARAVDTTGQPVNVPSALADIPRHTINDVVSYTKGTNTTATDAFVGDFRQLIIGQRLGITIKPLDQLYAATGQYGVVATWRGDVALARPAAFAVYSALTGAA